MLRFLIAKTGQELAKECSEIDTKSMNLKLDKNYKGYLRIQF